MPHLTPHIQPRKEQFGFRAEHSTTLQIAKITNHMAAAHNKKQFVAMALLDMEKAFDRVWHQGLLHKLSKAPTLPRSVHGLLESYLTDRYFVVQVENEESALKKVEAGVPQGSCVAPVCYAWYTDDIPVVGQAELALYADDAAYHTTSMSPVYAAKYLQRALDALPEWLSKWRLAINVTKTQAMISGKKKQPPPLTLLGQTIPWRSEVTYLGVKIDQGLNFASHVATTIARTKGARAVLRPVLASNLPIRCKLMLYKTYVRTRLTYAAPAWYPYTSETSKKRLQAQEHAALRTIVRAQRFVRNDVITRDLNWQKMEDFIKETATKLFMKADKSGHDHIRGIAPLHARPPSTRKRKRVMPFSRDLIVAQDDEENQPTAKRQRRADAAAATTAAATPQPPQPIT